MKQERIRNGRCNRVARLEKPDGLSEARDFSHEFFTKQKEHDRLKKEYAKKHGYKLIIIKYTYDSYESISEYMAKELKKIEI